MGDLDTEEEGRIITLEFERFYLVNVYTPNAKRDLTRLPYRLEWEDEMRAVFEKVGCGEASNHVRGLKCGSRGNRFEKC